MSILIIATNNLAKFREIQDMASTYGIIVRMPDKKIDVEEGVESYEDNARLKALTLTSLSGIDALGEDSGIEIPALGGFPGVISARFTEGSDNDRNAALLGKMMYLVSGQRKAVFKAYAVITLTNGRYLTGYGELKGSIIDEPAGNNGFGYDPIFIPDSYDRTLAQLSSEQKNSISHRRKAIEEVMGKYMVYVR